MVHYDNTAADAERQSLLTEIKQHIDGKAEQEMWEEAFKEVCDISAPVYSDEFIPISEHGPKQLSKIVLQGEFGLEGAHSFKAGNVRVNLGALIESSIEGGLAIFEAITKPYVLIMVGLLTCRKLYKAGRIDLGERHAMVIACLWKLKEPEHLQVMGKDLLARVNTIFKSLQRNELTSAELSSILSDLDGIHSIRLESNGSITLIEKIEVQY